MSHVSPRSLDDLDALASDVLDALKANGKMVATAESCTGGLICGVLTDIAGSSAAVERGFVTYSNEAKTELLGVPADMIRKHGAVSSEVAVAMADGAVSRSGADIAVSVTGIAGPGGGSEHKPVGTVYVALAGIGSNTSCVKCLFENDNRKTVRLKTVQIALNSILNALS